MIATADTPPTVRRAISQNTLVLQVLSGSKESLIPLMPTIMPMGIPPSKPSADDEDDDEPPLVESALPLVGGDIVEVIEEVGIAIGELDKGGSTCAASDGGGTDEAAAVVAGSASGEICAGPKT